MRKPQKKEERSFEFTASLHFKDGKITKTYSGEVMNSDAEHIADALVEMAKAIRAEARRDFF